MSVGHRSNLVSLSISSQIRKTVRNADLFQLAMQGPRPLYRKDFKDYSGIYAFEFDHNGSFFVTVLLQKLFYLQ